MLRMDIDLKRKLSKEEMELLVSEVGCYDNVDNFTSYTGQLRDLRQILLDNVPTEETEKVALMSDEEVHKVFINNLYIPLRLMNNSETIYLVPLDVLQQCEKLER